MLKTYITTLGRATLPISNKQGKLLFFVSFDVLKGDKYAYNSANTQEQKQIEDCGLFKKGLISLEGVVKTAVETEAKPKEKVIPVPHGGDESQNPGGNDSLSPMSFTSWQSAKTYLIKERGVDAALLNSPEDVQTQATALGVIITF